jgi:MoaA/NifB/PqqE/SkfB family radical SAM enzyme
MLLNLKKNIRAFWPVRRARSPVQEKINAVHDRLPPRFLFLQINRRCNLKCTHCDFWMNDVDDRSEHRTPERDREIIEEFARLSPYGTVTFCGGEAMLNLEEWFALTRIAHENGLRVLSVVNGSFIQTPEMAERVILEGPDEISLSLDSPDPAIHDRMRGVSGAFNQVVRATRLLLEARERHPEITKKPVIIMGLIGKTTYLHLESFYDLVLNRIGADKLKLNMIQPTFGNPKVDRFFIEEGDVNPRRLLKIINRCDKRFTLGMNPVWKKQVGMYFRSVSRCPVRGRGWKSKAGTSECVCNAVDRNIIVDLHGNARHCFSHGFNDLRIEKKGDLAAFWKARDAHRDDMLHCNRFCGISHSLKAESCTRAGNRKVEQFIEQSLTR